MRTPTGRGWHDHPDDPDGVQRWHDGRDWTDRTTGVATGRPRVAAEQEEVDEQGPLPDRRGWHQRAGDPVGVLRWFDGTAWTNRTTGTPKAVADDSPDAPVPEAVARLVPDARWESITATSEMSSWWIRSGATVAVVSRLPPSEVRITVGLAADVAYRAETSHHLNELNRTDLKFGRLFLVGNDESGRGAILMQEFLPGELLDSESPIAARAVRLVVATVLAQADRLAGFLVPRFSGRPFRDDEHFFILMCQ